MTKGKPATLNQSEDTRDSMRRRVEDSASSSESETGVPIRAKQKPRNLPKKISFFHEKYDVVWNHVLPFVSSEDIINFYTVDRRGHEIVKRCLTSGMEVRLNRTFLNQHPAWNEDHKDLYKWLGNSTRKLALEGTMNSSDSYQYDFSSEDIPDVIAKFKTIDHLTLQDFDIQEAREVPTINHTPKSLKLIRCDFKKSYAFTSLFHNILSILRHQVVSLELIYNDFAEWPFNAVICPHLERLTFQSQILSPSSMFEMSASTRTYYWGKEPANEKCPLHTLVLKAHQFIDDDELNLDLPNLKRLSITVQRPDKPQEFPVILTGLEHYTLDADWTEMMEQSQMNLTEEIIRNSPQLKTLQLPGCPDTVDFLFDYEHLQSLVISTDLNIEQIKRLAKLQEAKPNLKITYPNNSNAQLESHIIGLPEECLLILSHLDKEAMMNIRQVNKQFKKLFGKQASKTWEYDLKIDKNFLLKYPLNTCKDVYIGRGSSTLNIGKLPEDTAILLLRLFPNIKTLHLNIVGFTKIKEIKTFPRPEELHLTGHSKYFVHLYEHFRPSLKRLTCHTTGPHLRILHNLEEFTTHNNFFLLDMNAFWEQNRELKCFGILLEKDLKGCEPLSRIQENWKHIGELPHLKRIEVSKSRQGIHNEFVSEHLSEMASLSSLKGLKVDRFCRAVYLIKKILSDTLHLMDLSIIGPEDVKEMSRFQNIERLHLNSTPSTSYGCTKDKKAPFVLRCVTELPKLKDLKIDQTTLKEVYKEELVSFLRATNRSLRYNGTLLPLDLDDTDLDKYS